MSDEKSAALSPSEEPKKERLIRRFEQKKATAYEHLEKQDRQVPSQDYERGRQTGRVQAFSEALTEVAEASAPLSPAAQEGNHNEKAESSASTSRTPAPSMGAVAESSGDGTGRARGPLRERTDQSAEAKEVSSLSPAPAPLKEGHVQDVRCPKCGFNGGLRQVNAEQLWHCEMCQNDSTLQQIASFGSPQPPTSEHDDEVAMGLKQSRRLALILSDIRAIFDTNCVFTFDELPREVRKRIVGSPQPPSEARWQPIETAPKEDDQTVIVGFVETGQRKKPRRPYVGEAEYRNDVWWFLGDYVADNGCIDPQPTHWMPLPAPPRSPGETS